MEVKANILVIEDNKDIRESVEEILQLSNYGVFAADNGKRGIELAQLHLPDLILCDIMMPDLDGYGVLYLLHNIKQTANIPFIFLTARAERTDLRKGMELGADDYLTKPFDDKELLSAIETRLQKREQFRNFYEDTTSIDGLLAETRSTKLLTDLLESSRIRSYKKKQNVYAEGDQPAHAYLVKSGRIRTYMVYQDGREITTGLYETGEFFGYDSVLLNKPGSDHAETLETSSLILISQDEFNALLFKNPQLSRKFIQLLSGNVQNRQDQLLKLAYNSVRKRMADALVGLAEKFGLAQDDRLTIKITRDELAAMVATAHETVSRTLGDFKDERLIEKGTGTITILSIQNLKNVKQ
jgi:CRP-like cAMP-binding protein/CheY-like chemotaxis protein